MKIRFLGFNKYILVKLTIYLILQYIYIYGKIKKFKYIFVS